MSRRRRTQGNGSVSARSAGATGSLPSTGALCSGSARKATRTRRALADRPRSPSGGDRRSRPNRYHAKEHVRRYDIAAVSSRHQSSLSFPYPGRCVRNPSHVWRRCFNGRTRQFTIQFSTLRPGTRSNSRRLLVTSARSTLRAWAAMSASREPIGVPCSASCARTRP